jgi:hypothetical protein
MLNNMTKRNLVAALLASLLGGFVLLTQPFAGSLDVVPEQSTHSSYNPWTDSYEPELELNYVMKLGYDIGPTTSLAYFVISGSLAVLLFYVAWVSYRSLRLKQVTSPIQSLQLGFRAAALTCVVCLSGGGLFLLRMVTTHPAYWRFDWGFTGSLLCSGVAAVCLWLEVKSCSKAANGTPSAHAL